MFTIKEIAFSSFLLSTTLAAMPAIASQKASLDLEGDGKATTVNLPFKYFNSNHADHFTLIHQGGYKSYDCQKDLKEVAVIGTLRPCIGIAVTDGKNLVTFHKHSTNSFASMKTIIAENLDTSDPTNLYARIYTTRDDIEWQAHQRTLMHGGKSHLEEVKAIKDFLNREMGIPREKIPASLCNLRNAAGQMNY